MINSLGEQKSFEGFYIKLHNILPSLVAKFYLICVLLWNKNYQFNIVKLYFIFYFVF